MNISDRKKKILTVVIESYISTAEPVGSKSIAEIGSLELSSATIRNEMAELTSMGFLEQPHTSAGRTPSPKGYRFYVNELMERQRLTVEEVEEINRGLQLRIKQLDKLMSAASQLASSFTRYPALALTSPITATVSRFDLIYVDANTFIVVLLLSNKTVHNKLMPLPFSIEQIMLQRLCAVLNTSFTGLAKEAFTPSLMESAELACCDNLGLVSVVAAFTLETLSLANEGEAVVTGASQLLRQPEFRDPDKAHDIMSFLSDKAQFLDLPENGTSDDVQMLIGPENVAEELKDSSVVIARYDAGDNMRGLIGVVGPTRMDYSSVTAKLSYIAAGLTRLLNTEGALPDFEKMQIKGDDIDEQKTSR